MCESQVIQYIRYEYLSLDQLADRTGISTQRIQSLIEARCLPRHSYEVTVRTSVASFTGDREVSEKLTRYYAPSHAERLRDIEATTSSDLSLVADAVKRDFNDRFRDEIVACGGMDDGTITLGQLEDLIAEEFEHWLAGTYGLCTNNATVREIVLKAVAISRIKRLTEDGTRETLSPEDLRALQNALTTLDTVASMFAPDERKTCSREIWLNAIAKRYDIHPHVDHNLFDQDSASPQTCPLKN